MMRKWGRAICALCAAMLASLVHAGPSVMVLNVAGDVVAEAFGKAVKVQAFSRLLEGDRIRLGGDGKLSVVYAGSGRQEAWSGAGVIAAGTEKSAIVSGAPDLQVKQLPPQVVLQMTRTPLADATGRAGMVRMRNVATVESLEALENKYRELLGEAAPDDRAPQIFFLAGLYERSAYDRLGQELTRIEQAYPGDDSMQALVKLYAQAMNSGRKAGR